MDSNQFTIKTQEVIQAAQEYAQSEGHQAIENAHLLKGIFLKDADVVPYLFKQSQVNPKNIELALDRILESQSFRRTNLSFTESSGNPAVGIKNCQGKWR